MIRFGREICGDLDEATAREWLETNGLGGFASSTIAGLNARRYHGLLVAATKPPVGRIVMLSKFEETLVIDGRRYELSANQYPGVVHPRGFEYQTEFRLDPFPIFIYEVESFRLEKRVFMIHGENTTVIQYEIKKSVSEEENSSLILHPLSLPSSLTLELRPLIAFRDYHATTHENGALNSHVQTENNLVTVAPYADLPPLNFAHDADELDANGYWCRNFEYERERERGLDFSEDLFSPFALRFDLIARTSASVIASTERREQARAYEYREIEIERRETVVAACASDDETLRALTASADQFIVARGLQRTIIAGYHWFSDWGRDTMIALPGLTLVTGRFDVARSLLAEFARHVDRGMLPNRFPDAGSAPEYNTVDATLWYFEAVRAFLEHTLDYEFVRANLYTVLTDIIEWHMRGTRYNIHVDADGLLFSGEDGVQLTWMDVKIGDWVVTPRTGKAVEIQALWYNALRVMEGLAQKFGDDSSQHLYAEMAERARESFNQLFWNESAGCLYDVVDGSYCDASLRPNQIFAASLNHSMLTRERTRSVVEVVKRELLTPYGLRTLAPKDPQYRARYDGDSRSRDSAYHQGTVWPWLMGAFITAYMKAFVDGEDIRGQAREWLSHLREHLKVAGLNQISEIFDAEPPYTPRGCIAQAWSVAEVLRVLTELNRAESSEVAS